MAVAIQEAAASAGLNLNSMEQNLFQFFQSRHHHGNNQLTQLINCTDLTDFTVSKFKQVVSLLNRTGHARFRRRPSDPQTSSSYSPSPVQPSVRNRTQTLHFTKLTQFSMSSANSSIVPSKTGDGNVSGGKQGVSAVVTPAPAVSSGKPPLPSSHRKRCRDQATSIGKHSLSSGCHCSKRRKLAVTKVIGRVPAMSSKVADIPADDYSWRKYDQKQIKGSTYPRGYYECSSFRGCPARKYVEKAHDDRTMLIVTYEGDHRHSHTPLPCRQL